MDNTITEITPQDLSSVLSLLDYLYSWAKRNGQDEAARQVSELRLQYRGIFEAKESDLTKLPYNRKDYYNIFEYLKLQAEQLSNGAWNDFSDGDIGTVILKLMSYLADMENYHIDKSIAELYLSTCTERASALLLCKLIGYEPRHYMSAETEVWLGATEDENGVVQNIPNGTIFPRGSTFTTSDETYIYTTLEDFVFTDNQCRVIAYEGELKTINYKLSDITELGRIVLPDYAVAFNTAKLKINGEEYKRVDDVTINTGELAFSVHCSENRYIYVQLPAFWTDVVTSASTIEVSYCISNGQAGRLGKDRLVTFTTEAENKSNMVLLSNSASVEGYNPETIEEIKISAPIRARTMDTIVTIDDFEQIGSLVDGIAGIRALDYNDKSSGLVQPTPGPGGYVNDAYKVNIYVLPDTVPYDEDIVIEGSIKTDNVRDENIATISATLTAEDDNEQYDEDKTYSASMITGTTGEFALNLPKRGTYSVTISKPGYLNYIITGVKFDKCMHILLGEIKLISGDIDGNGVINSSDRTALQTAIDTNIEYDEKYDLNGDKVINSKDMELLNTNYNKTTAKDCTIAWVKEWNNTVDNNKYRNTIIKDRNDWVWTDMGKVAENVQQFSISSISGNQIVIPGEATTYTEASDIILGVDTLKELTSFLPRYVESIPGRTEDFQYTINIGEEDITITMCSNWKDFLPKGYCKLSVFFKQEQVLTTAGQTLRETIDSKRLHSLWITYYDVGIVQPKINVEVYMDSRNTEFETIASQVKDFVVERYSRDYLKIGDPIFASVIGADILDNFENIRYVEVGLPLKTDDLLEVVPREFIDIIPPNVVVEAIDYQNKEVYS